MKLLHTSDWHLGRGFHGFSLRDEQEEMLQTVCRTVEEHGVGAVLVAGDVYDRALPPEWAVQLLDTTLGRLRQLGAEVVITSGNHDSAARLGFIRKVAAASGLHFRTALSDAWTPVELADGTLVYGVPYLEPQLVAAELGVERANHTAVTAEVIRRIRQDRDRRSLQGRVVVMAHLFAASGVASESERNIGAEAAPGDQLDHHEQSAGGLAVVPLGVFDGFDYTALGHLHGRQRLSETVRYSGSPIRYSFSETRQAKGAWLYDTDTGQAEPLDWQIGRRLVQLRDEIEVILDPQTVAEHRDCYAQITLVDDQRPERAYQRVQEAYPYLASFTYSGAARAQSATTYSQKIAEARTDAEIITGFLEHVRSRGPSQAEQQLIQEAMETVRLGGAR